MGVNQLTKKVEFNSRISSVNGELGLSREFYGMLLYQDHHNFCSHLGVYDEQYLSNMESTSITGLSVAAWISKRVSSVEEIP